VSRQATLWLAVAVAFGLAGCASSTHQSADLKRLQARAAYERGLSNLRDQQTGLALAAFQEALGLDDETPAYWNTLGWLYLQLGKLDEAIPRFRKAIQLQPDYAEAHLNMGVALAEGAKWEEAVAEYKKAIALPTLSTPHVAHQNLGLALYHMKRYREAEDSLRFAISLDPHMAAPYYHLGLVYAAENRSEDAKSVFRRARDLDPKSPFGQAAVQRLKALGDGG